MLNNAREIHRPSTLPTTRGSTRVTASRRTVAPRVVVLPGILGAVLVDQSLPRALARKESESNLGSVRDRLWRGKRSYPCDKRPEALWGEIGSLHWFFNPSLWFRRMTRGNGYDNPVPIAADSLVDFAIGRTQIRPYAALVQALRTAGADVLVFPCD
jgi:hypothetical protein